MIKQKTKNKKQQLIGSCEINSTCKSGYRYE